MAKTERTPVMIDAEMYAEFKRYSEQTGVALSKIVRRGLRFWMDSDDKKV